MRVTTLETSPAWSLPFLNAAGGRRTETLPLPFLRGTVDRLPEGVDALVVASDLQGREVVRDGPPRLVGEAVAEELELRSLAGDLPSLDRVGVLLAGDLWSSPGADKRGGYGDVRSVWRAFDEQVRWVAGVAGNHDGFGKPDGFAGAERFAARGCGHLLDGGHVSLDGLRVGGVGGIVGNPRKPMRRWAEDYLERVASVLDSRVEVLVLHESPPTDERTRRKGNEGLRELLEIAGPVLLVCGHTHWSTPLVEIGQVQALNVDGRVVVLTQEEGPEGRSPR